MKRILVFGVLGLAGSGVLLGRQQSTYPQMPAGHPALLEVPDSAATEAGTMKPYRERIVGSDVSFPLLPISGGRFRMGCPEDEWHRSKEEGPTHEVSVGSFWMGKHEVTWDEYQLFMSKLDIERRQGQASEHPQDAWADAVSRPTPPYVPMDFEMGVKGFPAISMTQFAAKQYTKWLSMKTGRFYRLPTEAEWEYACRAGTTTAYSFGDDPGDLDDYAWYFDNGNDAYHLVGTKKPNPWGLHDMHGNVAEWVLDRLDSQGYGALAKDVVNNPLAWPEKLYPRVVRGGSWDDDPEDLRSAARKGSRKGWKVQDPQLPKSIWYHTNAAFVGFRVLRPFPTPPAEEWAKYWDPDLESVQEIMERQRQGDR